VKPRRYRSLERLYLREDLRLLVCLASMKGFTNRPKHLTMFTFLATLGVLSNSSVSDRAPLFPCGSFGAVTISDKEVANPPSPPVKFPTRPSSWHEGAMCSVSWIQTQ
jgi:hypothetical protein